MKSFQYLLLLALAGSSSVVMADSSTYDHSAESTRGKLSTQARFTDLRQTAPGVFDLVIHKLGPGATNGNIQILSRHCNEWVPVSAFYRFSISPRIDQSNLTISMTDAAIASGEQGRPLRFVYTTGIGHSAKVIAQAEKQF